MKDSVVYLLGFALIAVVLPVLRRKFRSGKNVRDFDEGSSFVDKYSR